MTTWQERFWAKVDTTGDCWEWVAGRMPSGYGSFSLNGKMQRAHRVSWVIENGPIPDGLVVMHSCDTPPCVNPNHLSLGTQRDNLRDMADKGRHASSIKTHCPSGHPYDETNTYVEPSGDRQCRECRKEYMREYRSLKKASAAPGCGETENANERNHHV